MKVERIQLRHSLNTNSDSVKQQNNKTATKSGYSPSFGVRYKLNELPKEYFNLRKNIMSVGGTVVTLLSGATHFFLREEQVKKLHFPLEVYNYSIVEEGSGESNISSVRKNTDNAEVTIKPTDFDSSLLKKGIISLDTFKNETNRLSTLEKNYSVPSGTRIITCNTEEYEKALNQSTKTELQTENKTYNPEISQEFLHKICSNVPEADVIDFYIKHVDEIDVNAQNKDGDTALHGSARYGEQIIGQLLLDNPNIDINIRNKHLEAAFVTAAISGATDIVRAFVKRYNIEPIQKDYALFWAKKWNHTDIISLLENGTVELKNDSAELKNVNLEKFKQLKRDAQHNLSRFNYEELQEIDKEGWDYEEFKPFLDENKTCYCGNIAYFKPFFSFKVLQNIHELIQQLKLDKRFSINQLHSEIIPYIKMERCNDMSRKDGHVFDENDILSIMWELTSRINKPCSKKPDLSIIAKYKLLPLNPLGSFNSYHYYRFSNLDLLYLATIDGDFNIDAEINETYKDKSGALQYKYSGGELVEIARKKAKVNKGT